MARKQTAQLLLYPSETHPIGCKPIAWNSTISTDSILREHYKGREVYQYIGTVTEVKKSGQLMGYKPGRLYCTSAGDWMCVAETVDHRFIFRNDRGSLAEINREGVNTQTGIRAMFVPDVLGPEETTYELVKE